MHPLSTFNVVVHYSLSSFDVHSLFYGSTHHIHFELHFIVLLLSHSLTTTVFT